MENIVERIKSTNAVLKEILEILEKNHSLLSEFGIYVSPQRIDELKRISEDLEFYRNKLEKNIMEVAFVGLEKAGKSTLINAIISKNILPSAYKRTTYTTTRIEYSEKPSMEISFYERNEFIKEVFRKMLKDIGYPNYEHQNLNTVSAESIKKHFESMRKAEKQKYEMYEGSSINNIINDILEIIEGREVIENLLTGSVIRVSLEELNTYKDYIVHEHKSRAVKEVKIFTDELKGLENVIFYDLPGFNSPTLIHSKFTKEKIRRADAVVFVKRAKTPSIEKSEAEIIQETREEDGVKLKDKVFFFCNMVDEVPNREDLNEIKENFVEALNKHGVFNGKERIIYGSALARLQKNGVVAGSNALNGLLNLGLDDGIQELLEKLKDYNQNERRKVIQRRAEALMEKVERFVEELGEKLTDVDDPNISDSAYVEKVISVIRKARQEIKEKLEDFQYEVKNLLDDKPMSEYIRKQLGNDIKFDNLVSEQHIKKTRNEVQIKSSTKEERPDDYNRRLRGYIRERVREKLYSTIEKTVEVNVNDIKTKIMGIFAQAFSIEDEEKREKFLTRLEELMKSHNIDFSPEKLSLNKLIERFGGDIIQLLIENPLTSTDRYNKFEEIKNEFYSLLAYHEEFSPDVPPASMPIIKKLLYQIDIIEEIEKQLDEILSNLKISASAKEKDELIKLLIKVPNPTEFLSNRVAGNAYIKSLEDIKAVIKNSKDYTQYNDSTEEVPDALDREVLISRKPKTYEDVEKEIKTDIENLKEILTKCVVNAINTEKMVVNQIISYLDMLIKMLDTEEFEKFVNRNVSLIMPKFIDERIKLQTKHEEVKKLRSKIDQLLRHTKGVE